MASTSAISAPSLWYSNSRSVQVVLNSREAVAKTLVKQGASFQTRPEWDLWHQTFVHSADTGGVVTIGSEFHFLLPF